MSRRILVIDDDAMNLRMAEFILKKNACETVMATSGAEGIERLQNEKFDLVLLDIEMPDMNGIETLEKMRGVSELERIPVIFLTASSEQADVMKADALGALDFVKKPFLPNDLLERVEKALE